jgi:hypothetical protein
MDQREALRNTASETSLSPVTKMLRAFASTVFSLESAARNTHFSFVALYSSGTMASRDPVEPISDAPVILVVLSSTPIFARVPCYLYARPRMDHEFSSPQHPNKDTKAPSHSLSMSLIRLCCLSPPNT